MSQLTLNLFLEVIYFIDFIFAIKQNNNRLTLFLQSQHLLDYSLTKVFPIHRAKRKIISLSVILLIYNLVKLSNLMLLFYYLRVN